MGRPRGFYGFSTATFFFMGFLRVKTWFLDPPTISTPIPSKANSKLVHTCHVVSRVELHFSGIYHPDGLNSHLHSRGTLRCLFMIR